VTLRPPALWMGLAPGVAGMTGKSPVLGLDDVRSGPEADAAHGALIAWVELDQFVITCCNTPCGRLERDQPAGGRGACDGRPV
jgi:hypothetical protein